MSAQGPGGLQGDATDILALVLEHTPAAIAVLDTEMRYVAVSRRYVSDLRLEGQELAGKSLYDAFPSITEERRAVHRRCLAGAVDRRMRERFARSDGTVDWVNCEMRPWHDASGAVRGLLVFCEVLTDQIHVLESLRETEELLREFFDQSVIGLAQVDPASGRMLRVNAKACEVSRRTREELLSTDWQGLIHPDDLAACLTSVARVVEGHDKGSTIEVRQMYPDGGIGWVRASLSRLDLRGGKSALIATVEDVTERKTAQRDLELQMRAFQAADHGIVITDAQGIVERVNPAARRLTGYDESELVGRPLRILKSGRQTQDFYRALWEKIQSGQVWRGEIVNRRKDGTLYYEDETITPVHDASGVVTHYIAIKQDVSERKRTELALAIAEEQHRLALVAADLGSWTHDLARRQMVLDARAMEHLGFDRSELSDEELLARVHPEDRRTTGEMMERAHDPQGDGVVAHESRMLLPSGEVRWLSISAKTRFEGEGAARHAMSTVVTSRDITQAKLAEQRQRETEEQLRAAQKMEAIGRLAGGVAHDFNNLLGVILAYAELVGEAVGADEAASADVAEIVRAAQRAAHLTNQLLAFSRRQPWCPQSLDLKELLDGVSKMLRRLIGEDIELHARVEDDLFRSRADRGQIEQILMNLAVNARDAMPDGGRLTIAMANTKLDAQRAQTLQVTPGDYVELRVTDTGCGMDAATLARVFEPFFTTKGLGKGTGLGLSIVYGIVRQSGGAIAVESRPGAGTTFRIHLQRDDRVEAPSSPEIRRALPPGKHETVLVVEDETAVRKVVVRILKAAGYVVLESANGADALDLCEKRAGDISVILADVVMPGMNGRDLAERLRDKFPAAKVIFISGYTDDTIERLDVLGHDLLRKPFSAQALVTKVRAALDGAAQDADAAAS